MRGIQKIQTFEILGTESFHPRKVFRIKRGRSRYFALREMGRWLRMKLMEEMTEGLVFLLKQIANLRRFTFWPDHALYFWFWIQDMIEAASLTVTLLKIMRSSAKSRCEMGGICLLILMPLIPPFDSSLSKSLERIPLNP